MKQNLLLSAVLLTGIAVNAQNARQVSNTGVELQKKFSAISPDAQPAFPEKNYKPTVNNPNKVQGVPYKRIASSHNAFTLLVSQSNALTYNKSINAIMFTHRKNFDWNFTTPAGANSGSIQSTWTTNNGTSWDSTITWVDATNLARYPSGAIYNPSGNTTVGNAKAVVMGPVTSSTDWTGNYFSSGPLTPNAITTSGMNYVAFNETNTTNGNSLGGRMAFARIDVQEAGGKIFGTAGLYKASDAANYLGTAIIKATTSDNGATFVWSCDSIKPSFLVAPDGSMETWDRANIAFSPDGQIGYLVFMGIEANATGSKKAYQPIVYKSTNAGSTWVQVNAGYDWTTNTCLMGTIAPVKTNPSLFKPWFTQSYGSDATVDKQGRLHLVCSVASGSSDHVDSLGYTYLYNYTSEHPYIWDFVTDGGGTWTEYFVDSLMTNKLDNKQSENPWVDGSDKMPYDNRLQVSRTTDGSKIFIGWIDSDQDFTGTVFNTAPDIYVRGFDPTSLRMTERISVNHNTQECFWMYMSNITRDIAVGQGQYHIPFTYSLSRDGANDTGNPVDHFYIDDAIIIEEAFERPYFGCAYTGVKESKGAIESVSQSYPNPFDKSATIKVSLTTAEDIKLSVYNTMGQLVSSKTVKGNAGVNNLDVDAAALSSGVYFYSVKVNENVVTKKMTVQK